MIKVNILKKDNNYKKIVISGHSGYDEEGKDIVCAAVSSASLNTISGIMLINDSINYEQKKDTLTINVLKHNEITEKLLLNLINNLKEIEKDYKKNIMIKEE